MVEFGSMGATRKDVEEVVAKIGRKLARTGIVSTILGIAISIGGIAIELLIKAEYGFVLMAIGALGIGTGLALLKD